MQTLYIGQYTPGTTSKMRADQLKEILSPGTFDIVDTHQPFYQTPKLWRSLGFRYKNGPLIRSINNFVKEHIKNAPANQFDLVWVDKGIFLTRKTTRQLKEKTNR
jgi:spore maturation protein CgeB